MRVGLAVLGSGVVITPEQEGREESEQSVLAKRREDLRENGREREKARLKEAA